MADDETPQSPPPFRLSTAVYAQRAGKILLLQRAMGEVTGGWYLPGGAVDADDETLEDAARRELFEESGLTPDGPLTIIGAFFMRVYGQRTLQVTYAADCPAGDVVLSAEHSDAQWMDPLEYRDTYFTEAFIASVREKNARIADLMRGIRTNLDTYIGWRAGR